jgi:hypothetical protein
VSIEAEEEVVVLYTLHKARGVAPRRSAVEYIIENDFLKAEEGVASVRATMSHLNPIRDSLVRKKHVQTEKSQPHYWYLTDAGRERLFRIARNVFEKTDADRFDQFSETFLRQLRELGRHLSGKNWKTETTE